MNAKVDRTTVLFKDSSILYPQVIVDTLANQGLHLFRPLAAPAQNSGMNNFYVVGCGICSCRNGARRASDVIDHDFARTLNG